MMKDAGLRVRVEKQLREEFVDTCRQQGKHAAEVLRAFMRDYIAREGGGMQGSLFQGANSAQAPAAVRTRNRKKGKWAKRS